MVIKKDTISDLYEYQKRLEIELNDFITKKDVENIQRTIGKMCFLDRKINLEEGLQRAWSANRGPIEIDDMEEIKKINEHVEDRRQCMLKILQEIKNPS